MRNLQDSDGRAPDPALWAELEGLALPAREHKRLSPPVRDAILVALCARAALSRQELAVLLARSEVYVREAAAPLVRDGRLAFLYPGRPNHPRQRYVAGPQAGTPNVNVNS